MKLYHFSLVALFMTSALLQACSTMQVSSEKSPGADLTRYKTFSWAPPAMDQNADNQILDQNIRAALDSSLKQSGFIPASNGGSPDFLVRYSVSSRNVEQVVGGWYGPDWGAYRTVPPTVERYKEGSLIVEFIDAKSKTPFWRGVAEAEITSQAEVIPKAREASQKIIAEYVQDEKKWTSG